MAGSKRWSRPVLGLAAAALVITGCGSETYEERLETTSKYFASIQLQNDHLSKPWTDSATTISLRLPLQFQELPPPVDTGEPDQSAQAVPGFPPDPSVVDAFGGSDSESSEDDEMLEDGEEAEGAEGAPPQVDLPHDTRQPTYLNTQLPGLRGAFKAAVNVVGQGNRVAVGSGYIYVLSNHYLAGNQDAAARFHRDLTDTLAGALGIVIRPEASRELRLPTRPDAFVKPVVYTEIEVEPEEQGDELAREFGVATRFNLYLASSGDVQMAVLFVLPRDLDNSEKFPLRKLLSLETLKIDNAQLLKPGGPSGGGTPATSSGSAF